MSPRRNRKEDPDREGALPVAPGGLGLPVRQRMRKNLRVVQSQRVMVQEKLNPPIQALQMKHLRLLPMHQQGTRLAEEMEL